MHTDDNFTSGSGTEDGAGHFKPLPFFSRFILVFTSLSIAVTNIVVLAVLGRMRSCLIKMQLFLQSLAVADLLVGLMWFALHIESIVGYDLYVMSNWLCLMIVHLPAVALTVSVLTLSLISIERYIAVVKPFRYHRLITRRRAKHATLSVWLMSVALFVPVYLALLFSTGDNPERNCENNFSEVLYTCLYMVTIIIVPNVFLSLYCYTCIVRNIVKRDKLLGRHQSSMRRAGRRRSERTLAKISISVYSGFYITWLPFVVVSFIAYIDVLEISPVIYYSTLNTGLWNSLLNCLIYSISHKPFRTELKLLVHSCCCCCCCCCCCVKEKKAPATLREPWHTATFPSSQGGKPQLKTISREITRDSKSTFNMSRHIAQVIERNI